MLVDRAGLALRTAQSELDPGSDCGAIGFGPHEFQIDPVAEKILAAVVGDIDVRLSVVLPQSAAPSAPSPI